MFAPQDEDGHACLCCGHRVYDGPLAEPLRSREHRPPPTAAELGRLLAAMRATDAITDAQLNAAEAHPASRALMFACYR
jgi:hypothetical protein